MNQKDRMLDGKLYHASIDKNLYQEYCSAQLLVNSINSKPNIIKKSSEAKKRELFGQYRPDSFVGIPLYCDYGKNTYFGKRFFGNYGCTFLDVCKIEFGDDVFVGPHCSFITAIHPIDKDVRNTRLESGKPIKVGSNCWFGANVTILPGVTIGNGVVIGAGSVVTKDLPDDTICVGNPCKVLRKITVEDHKKWSDQQKEWEDIFSEI